MADTAASRVWQLLVQAEAVAFYLVVAPLLGLLPSRIAYRAACWRGDWTFRHWADKRAEVLHGLRQVLGEEPGSDDAERLARDVFRIRSCEIIDLMLLRGQARALRRLVDIRGREHLDAALAAGKGAILCSPHAGSYLADFSLLHADGYPVTTIGRWWWKYPPGQSSAAGRVWDFVFARRVLRHRQRPNIEPWPGRVQVAVQTATALRANEVVTICPDSPPLDAERGRALTVPFLGRKAVMLPGVVPLATVTGATVLTASVVPHGRLPPPGGGDLTPGPDGRHDGDRLPALRDRDGRRHPRAPGRVGFLVRAGRPGQPRAASRSGRPGGPDRGRPRPDGQTPAVIPVTAWRNNRCAGPCLRRIVARASVTCLRNQALRPRAR